MDWLAEPLESPFPVPYIEFVGLEPDIPDQTALNSTTGVSLALVDELDSRSLEVASLQNSVPHFGLPLTPFSAWSIKSARLQALKQSLQSNDTSMVTSEEPIPPTNFGLNLTDTASSSTPQQSRILGEAKRKHYSQNSRLSEQQHRHWWSLRNSLTQSIVGVDSLKLEVAAEQRLYKESLKEMILTTSKLNFTAFPSLVAETMEKWLEFRKQASLKYHPFYVPDHSISTMPYLDHKHSILPLKTVKRGKILFSPGMTFELPLIETPFHPVILPRLGDFFLAPNQPKPTNETISAKKITFYKQMQPVVSCDVFAREIVNKTDCSFVLSSSTLSTIIDPNIEHSWQLPIVVVEQGQPLRRVVYLDKPLLPMDMTIKEKNQKFYKMSMKRWLLQNQQCMKMNQADQIKIDATVASDTTKLQMPSVENGPDNLVYTQWQLDDLNILIRSRVDGLSPGDRSKTLDASQPFSAPPLRQTGIVAKLKHVPDDQLEEFSSSEKAKYLMKSYLMGEEARLFVGHIDPVSARLVSVEPLSQQQIRTPGSTTPELYLAQLHSILIWLHKLPVGEFLLSHDSGQQRLSICDLFAEKNQIRLDKGIAATHSLHERQSQAGRSNFDTLDYLPPRWDYQRLHQIPNTFPPASRSFCFDFTKSGKCGHPTTCTHVHLTAFEAELRGFQLPATHSHSLSSTTTDLSTPSSSTQDITQDPHENTSSSSKKRSRKGTSSGWKRPNKKPRI